MKQMLEWSMELRVASQHRNYAGESLNSVWETIFLELCKFDIEDEHFAVNAEQS